MQRQARWVLRKDKEAENKNGGHQWQIWLLYNFAGAEDLPGVSGLKVNVKQK